MDDEVGRDDHFSLGAKSQQLELPLRAAPSQGVPFLRHGARAYAAQQGLKYSDKGLDTLQADPHLQGRVAAAYDKGEDASSDHRVKKAYKALGHEVGLQFDHLTKPITQGGMGVSVSFQDDEPYKGHHEMLHDIHKNRQLKVLSSAATGGAPHALMDEDTNNKFRAVHDAFGHAAAGRSFSRHGEEAAYHSHMQMFTDVARPALATETRAQNSWLNYKGTGAFPKQKAMVMPDWATKSRVQGPRNG